jgi:hypothetical protein
MLNKEKVGRPLCRVVGGELSKKIISVNTDDTKETTEEFPKLELKEGCFQQIPNKNTEREIVYITGASGSGKSTYTRKYCEEYRKCFPKREIYMFSSLAEDESLDSVKPKRIILDDRLITEPLLVQDFEECLVIADDIDVIRDKLHRRAVWDLLDQILETGRHTNTSCIITNHLHTGGRDTKRILNEAHSVVFFSHSGSARGLRYLVENYLGGDIQDIKAIKKMKSRWTCWFKNYPQIIMNEKCIWLASNEDEKEEKKIETKNNKKQQLKK